MTYLKSEHPNHEATSTLAAMAGQHNGARPGEIEQRDERRDHVTEIVRSVPHAPEAQAGAFIERQLNGSDPRLAADVLGAIRGSYF